MSDSQQSPKTWQQVLQEYISDDCDYNSDEAGPLAAFRLAVSEVVAREHDLRYEGEEMGAFRTLKRAIADLRTDGLEAIAGLEARLESLERSMVADGYDFATELNKIDPPSTALAESPAVTRRIQHAYDVAMAFQTGGDPGTDLLAAAFTDAFGGDTVFSLELKDRPGSITIDTRCQAGAHLFLEDDNLRLRTVPLLDGEEPTNVVQAATGRRWYPLCLPCMAAGYYSQPRDIDEVTDPSSLFLHIRPEDREQIRFYLYASWDLNAMLKGWLTSTGN